MKVIPWKSIVCSPQLNSSDCEMPTNGGPKPETKDSPGAKNTHSTCLSYSRCAQRNRARHTGDPPTHQVQNITSHFPPFFLFFLSNKTTRSDQHNITPKFPSATDWSVYAALPWPLLKNEGHLQQPASSSSSSSSSNSSSSSGSEHS